MLFCVATKERVNTAISTTTSAPCPTNVGIPRDALLLIHRPCDTHNISTPLLVSHCDTHNISTPLLVSRHTQLHTTLPGYALCKHQPLHHTTLGSVLQQCWFSSFRGTASPPHLHRISTISPPYLHSTTTTSPPYLHRPTASPPHHHPQLHHIQPGSVLQLRNCVFVFFIPWHRTATASPPHHHRAATASPPHRHRTATASPPQHHRPPQNHPQIHHTHLGSVLQTHKFTRT